MEDGGGRRKDAVAVLSHFPAYATIIFVCLAVASKNPQMVHGSCFTVLS